MTKTTLSGLKDTIQALDKLGKLDTKPMKELLQRQGQKIINDAKANCPSTHVKAAIKLIKKDEGHFPTTVLIGIDSNSPGTDTMTVNALASMLEFGSVPRFTKEGKFRGQVHAKPFMRPAFDMNKDTIKQGIETGLVKLVEQQAKKLKLK